MSDQAIDHEEVKRQHTVKMISLQLSEKIGGDAYQKFCKEWNQEPTEELEKVFRAGIACGSHAAFSYAMEAGKL